MAKYDSKVKRCLDEFSLELYHHIASWPEVVPRNLCLSPLSISAALMMTYLGAKETTQMEIESALRLDKHFGENKEDLILEAFKEVFPILCPPITDHQNYTIALANKFYIKEGLQLKPGFVASVMKKLKSEVSEVEFLEERENARLEINAWVTKRTHGKIENYLAAGTVHRTTSSILVNAVYFTSPWQHHFDEKALETGTFYNLDGKEVPVSMMTTSGARTYDYYDNFAGNICQKTALPPFQMLRLPYKANEMSMYIFLPRDRAGLRDFEKAINYVETLQNVYSNCTQQIAKVWLPRFRLEETCDLIPFLEKTGIRNLFSGTAADLSGVADTLTDPQPLHVSRFTQKAVIEINEKGAENPVVKEAIFRFRLGRRATLTPESPKPIVEFRVDHPFAFAVRHEPTGLITFLGRVAKL